ncbi:GNAT family N-acetyltransferase [Pelosinus propionicus]|uniref:N-acetyltransferase domain-containing protein n=1 Tax=Pelosinus propionicus DSM 13327 TaxID=1123291 RepID=A0A1I4L196_9FIRM|nr:GNAT family N-acetyltransferase [Pelosinus propionicus]SFL84790.1 hypothetical protein SAMN04490355_102127 [Pelosinus propionicus DSM 13327]
MILLLSEKNRDEVIQYLRQERFASAFILGNVLEFGLDNCKDQRRCGDYYGYFLKGRLVGILPFYNMGSCIPLFHEEEAIEPFAQIMTQRSLEALIGMKRFVQPLYEIISGEKNTLAYQDSSYFVNESLKPFQLEGSSVAEANELEHHRVVTFVKDAYWHGFHQQYSLEEVEAFVEQRGIEEELLFFMAKDKMVAQAYIQACTDKINQIGGVYTVEEERGKGYCKALVSKLCHNIIKRGKTPTLIVRKNNFSAVRAYTSLGFSYFDDYLLIKFQV